MCFSAACLHYRELFYVFVHHQSINSNFQKKINQPQNTKQHQTSCACVLNLTLPFFSLQKNKTIFFLKKQVCESWTLLQMQTHSRDESRLIIKSSFSASFRNTRQKRKLATTSIKVSHTTTKHEKS